MAIRAVIDTDPGIDDAVAILYALASPAFEILGLTTVAGNIGIARTTLNAGRLLALAGREDIPVIAGADRPLARPEVAPLGLHGADGVGGISLPDPSVAARGDAVEWLADLLMAEPAGTITLLALGPLTNLALLLRRSPAAAGRLRGVIAMGGAIREAGNTGPRSEFNIAADPEAAAEVLAAGLSLTLIPLDVTRRVRAFPADCARLRASARPPAIAAAALIEAYFQTTSGSIPAGDPRAASRPLHDPCVMLAAEAPEMFSCEAMALGVDLSDGDDAGALIPAPGSPPVAVALGVDGQGAIERLIARLSA